eukprot:504945_1
MSSLTLLKITYIMLSLQITVLSLTETLQLKPSTISSAPDISVSLGPGASIINDFWHIDVISQQSADLHIELGPSWGFHSTQISTIELFIRGNTSTETLNNDGEIFFIFATTDTYFAELVSIDNIAFAYKQCPDMNKPLISRNITKMINSPLPERYYRYCNNSVNTQQQIGIDRWDNAGGSPYRTTAEWPMSLSIKNDPIANTIDYTYTDWADPPGPKLSSHFTSSFPTNQGLNIYISGESPGEDFNIFSVDITYSHFGTNTPTNAPITLPPTTLQPTLQPTTVQPTTNQPTTMIPSIMPTIIPTTGPITLNPTTIPLQPSLPSISPTQSPKTTIPTDAPTMHVPDVVCNTITLTISHLKGLSLSELNQNSKLQLFVSNVTNQAITNEAAVRGINANSFILKFQMARPNIEIIYKLCSFHTEAGLNILSDIVDEESNAIAFFIRMKITAYFKDDDLVSTNGMNVTISLHRDTGAVDISTSNTMITDVSSSIEIYATDANKAEKIPLYIACCILGAYLMLGILALIDSKYVRQNDYYMPEFIIEAAFQTLDTAS